MISYAGIALAQNDLPVAATAREALASADLCDFAELSGPAQNNATWPPGGRSRPVRLGSLWWPWGAARFAYAHVLATDNELAQIRPLVYGTSTTLFRPQTFTMDDARTGRRISTSLYLLPPKPLDQIAGNNGLSLLTLVDARFYWWEATPVDIEVTPGQTTWAQLIASIAAALGVTITTDTIAAAYLYPSAAFTSRYEFLPPLLDAALVNTGQRLVRKLDGTLITQDPLTAKKSQDAQLASWTKSKGGQYLFDASERPHDLQGLVPSAVLVEFPRQDSGVPNDPNPYTVTTTLSSLALPEYHGIAGHVGTELLTETAIAYYIAGTLQNGTELTALAKQAATDFYRWRLGRQFIRFLGIDPYTLEALSDHVEWLSRGDECSTWVRRGPYGNALAAAESQLSHFGSFGSNPPTGTPPGGNPACKPITLTEWRPACNAGFLWVYSRQASIYIRSDGCLARSYTEWQQSYSTGVACSAGPIILPNPIGKPGPPGQPGWYWDPVALQLWFWTGSAWEEVCFCGSGSGSGSGSGCTPGNCSGCTDAPYQWTITASGFTLQCAAFNGTWTLTPVAASQFTIGNCTWQYVGTVNGQTIVVTLTLVNGAWELDFGFGVFDPNALNRAAYKVTATSLPNCCTPLTLNYISSSCDDANAQGGGGQGPPQGEACPSCTGLTPVSWSGTFAGFGGFLAGINGTWTLLQGGPCEWSVTTLTYSLTLILGGSTIKLAIQYRAGGVVTAWATYGATLQAGNCCAPLTMYLATDGNAHREPQTIVLTPSCVVPPAPFPPTVLATPACCGGSGSGSGSGSGVGQVTSPCCPGALIPTTLYATITPSPLCPCLAGTYPLTWDPALSRWTYVGPAPCGQDVIQNPNKTLYIHLICAAGNVWQIYCDCGEYLSEAYTPADSVVCTPSLALAFNAVPAGHGCWNCQGEQQISVTQ